MLLGLTKKYDVVYKSDCPKNKCGGSGWEKIFLPDFSEVK